MAATTSTARECARKACAEHDIEHAHEHADLASDVWEPIVAEMLEAMRWGIDADQARYLAAQHRAKQALGYESLYEPDSDRLGMAYLERVTASRDLTDEDERTIRGLLGDADNGSDRPPS
jgi:hypothetical protein